MTTIEEDGEISTAIAVRPTTPFELVSLLVEKGADSQQIERMIAMCERWEEDRQRKAFNAAMNKAQQNMPVLVCDSFNQHTKSKYISLEAVNRQTKPVYTREGLSLSFGEDACPIAGQCRTTCEVAHTEGHSRNYFIDLPLDGVGAKGNANMTAIHGKLSADTYGMTRLVKKIFNLTISDDATDDDGNGNSVARINEEQMKWIEDMLLETEADKARFLKWAGIERLADMPQEKFPNARDFLNQKLQKQKGGK